MSVEFKGIRCPYHSNVVVNLKKKVVSKVW